MGILEAVLFYSSDNGWDFYKGWPQGDRFGVPAACYIPQHKPSSTARINQEEYNVRRVQHKAVEFLLAFDRLNAVITSVHEPNFY